jgi:hypothetical protein
VLGELSAKQPLETGQTLTSFPSHLSWNEGLSIHIVLFLIGGWNLVGVNVTHWAGHVWCWPWIAGWASVLVVHAVVVIGLAIARSGNTRRARPTKLEPSSSSRP